MSDKSTVEERSTISVHSERRARLKAQLESIIELYAEAICNDVLDRAYEPAIDAELARVGELLGMDVIARKRELTGDCDETGSTSEATQETRSSSERADEYTSQDALKDLKRLARIIPPNELKTMRASIDEFTSPTQHIAEVYDRMPRSTKGEYVAYLHYFVAGSDWYLVEKPTKDGIALGWAILNGDTQNAEYGDISLDELFEYEGSVSVRSGESNARIPIHVELDLWFDPTDMEKIIAKHEGRAGQESEDNHDALPSSQTTVGQHETTDAIEQEMEQASDVRSQAPEIEEPDNTKVYEGSAEALSSKEWKERYYDYFYESFKQTIEPSARASLVQLETELADGKRKALAKDDIKAIEERLKSAKALVRAIEQKSHSALLLEDVESLSRERHDLSGGVPTPRMVEWRIEKLSRESFEVVKNLDYYPTPPDIAEQLIDAARIEVGMTILEPSAGKGNLVDAIRRRFGSSVTIKCVEVSDHNAEILRLKGYDVIEGDFTKQDDLGRFDRVVMNPPYMKGIDWVHIQRAYRENLKDGGVLAALLPSGSVMGNGRESIAKHEFVESHNGTIRVFEADEYNRTMEQQSLTIDIALITLTGEPPKVLTKTERAKSADSGYQQASDRGTIDLPERHASAVDTTYVKPDIVTAQKHLVPKEDTIPDRCPEVLRDRLLDHQKFGVNLAINALESRGGFLLADGTGAGKTIQMLTIATHFWRKEKKPIVIFTIDDRVIRTSFMEDARKIGMATPGYVSTAETKTSDVPERPRDYTGLYDKVDRADRAVATEMPSVVIGDQKTFRLKNGINMFTYTALSLFKASEKEEKAYNVAKGHKRMNQSFWSKVASTGRDLIKKAESREEFLSRIGTDPSLSKDEGTKFWLGEVFRDMYIDSRELQRKYANFVRYSGKMPEKQNTFVEFVKADDRRMDSIKNSMREIIDDTALVIFDEAHKIKNLADQEEKAVGRAYYASFITRNCKRVMFATATPCDRPFDMLYLQRAGLFKDVDQFKKIMRLVGIFYEAELRNEFGQVVRRGRWKVDRSEKNREYANINVANLFDFITREGCMLRREIQYTNLDVNMMDVIVPEVVKDELQLITESCTYQDEKGKTKIDKLKELLLHTEAMERHKLEAAIELTQKEVAEGRSVVIFTSFVDEEEREDGDDKLGSVRLLRNRFAKLYGEKAVGVLVSAAGRYESFRRLENVAQFQSGERRVLVGTITSGGTGVNLDDQIGNAPRTIIIITAPLTFINVMQGIGRVVRANTKSRSRVNFLFAKTDNPEPKKATIVIETWLKNILATKFKTLKAAVKGEIDILDPDAIARIEQSGESGVVSAIEESESRTRREHSWYTQKAKKILGWELPSELPIQIERYGDRYKHYCVIKARTKSDMQDWVDANPAFIKTWRLERNVDQNYQRYNGLHWGVAFYGAKDWEASYDVWNAMLNLVQPEDFRWMQQEESVYKVGDAVQATTNIIHANAAIGARGVIKSIVPFVKGTIGSETLYSYRYDVLFENGYTATTLESWQLLKNGGEEASFAKYRVGDSWTWEEGSYTKYTVQATILDVDINEGKVEYRMAKKYVSNQNTSDEFVIIEETELAKGLAEHNAVPYVQPSLDDEILASDTPSHIEWTPMFSASSHFNESDALFLVSSSVESPQHANDAPSSADAQSSTEQSASHERNSREPASDTFKAEDMGFYTLADAASVTVTQIKLNRVKTLLRKLNARFTMLIWGEPGQGKSSFTLLLAEDLARNGTTLMVLREERIASGRVGARARRMSVRNAADIVLNDKMSIAELRQVLTDNPSIKFVIVDSLQRWDKVTEEEIDELINDYPDVSFVFIAQSNKQGREYRGFAQLANTVDTVIHVKHGIAYTTKHRDAESGHEMRVFSHPIAVVKAPEPAARIAQPGKGILFQGLKIRR